MTPPVTVWIPGTQLLDDHPALNKAEEGRDRKHIRVLLIESQALLSGRPAHPQKRVLIVSAMRHYAQRLRKKGYPVDYRPARSFLQGMTAHVEEHSPSVLISMEAANYQGRQFQNTSLPEHLPLPLDILPNAQFLVGQHDPHPDPEPGKRVLLEYFCRGLRRHFGILMKDDGEPAGGEWNYDQHNREPLPQDIEPPQPRAFPPDPITRAAIKDLSQPGWIPGGLDFQLAATHAQAEEALKDFIEHRLENFGRYEDAMAVRSGTLFHSVLSPYLNIGLLTPSQVVRAAEDAFRDGRAPINSAEGFIRQVLGWREYMYWQYHRSMPDLEEVNFLEASRPLPDFFWTGETDLNCLEQVLKRAHHQGYNHHIERLMVLSNFCTLAGIHPREVLDWFMATYIDAYHWVMVPNVMGMGLYADGGVIGTKPYVSSANYIHKMSDYCSACEYDRRKRTGKGACPFNFLYWHFLLQHQEQLGDNPRMSLMLSNLRHLDREERERVGEESDQFLSP